MGHGGQNLSAAFSSAYSSSQVSGCALLIVSGGGEGEGKSSVVFIPLLFFFIHMNSCQAPHLQMSPKHFTITAMQHNSLLQSDCKSCMTLKSDCTMFSDVHRSGYSTVW